MPEAPDLFVIREYLDPRITGRKITAAIERRPLVVRNLTGISFPDDIAGRRITAVGRVGKLLIIELGRDRLMIVSPMLTGGLMHALASRRMTASTVLVLELDDGMQLRYFDQKRMGQVYYLPPGRREEITRLENQGPDVLDEPLDFAGFKDALKPFRGEIKGVLTRGRAVSGIGNAYADEILFDAQIYPFKKRTRLTEEELRRLHRSTYQVPAAAVAILRNRVGEQIHRKLRDFLKVHGHTGEACPRCGSRITAITANRRETNYCRSCQRGSLLAR